MIIKCDNCGKEFNKIPSRIQKHKHNFCSDACYRLFKNTNKYVFDGDVVAIQVYDSKGNKYECIIDAEDFEKVKYNTLGVKINKKYNTVYFCFKGLGNLLLHRLIMDCPKDMIVDHINHDTSDNRKQNLRICTHSDNMKNLSHRNKKYGISGIRQSKNGSYEARITYNGVNKQIGTFATLDEAIKARKEAENMYFKNN